MVQPSLAEETHTGIPRETAIPPQVALQGSYLRPVVAAKPSVLLLPGSMMEARKSVSLVHNLLRGFGKNFQVVVCIQDFSKVPLLLHPSFADSQVCDLLRGLVMWAFS